MSNPNLWDENWSAQEDVQRQVVIIPDQRDDTLDLPEAGDEEQINAENPAVPPVEILDIPNEVMEGIFG